VLKTTAGVFLVCSVPVFFIICFYLSEQNTHKVEQKICTRKQKKQSDHIFKAKTKCSKK